MTIPVLSACAWMVMYSVGSMGFSWFKSTECFRLLQVFCLGEVGSGIVEKLAKRVGGGLCGLFGGRRKWVGLVGVFDLLDSAGNV